MSDIPIGLLKWLSSIILPRKVGVMSLGKRLPDGEIKAIAKAIVDKDNATRERSKSMCGCPMCEFHTSAYRAGQGGQESE